MNTGRSPIAPMTSVIIADVGHRPHAVDDAQVVGRFERR